MSEIAVYEQQDVMITREPDVVLNEARKAAKALKDVVSQKAKPVMMNGEQYLEFEDWQTVGKFYGVTAKVIQTAFIDYGNAQGFEAKAVAIRPDGMEVSAAEAMCLNDEPNWKSKPLFQLRSMAQTRACAKALRNCLAWVVVLAGYRPTPAEEIQDMTGNKGMKAPEPKSSAPPDASGTIEVTGDISKVMKKEGSTKGKPWTLYSIFIMDSAYNTFDKKIAEDAKDAQEIGAPVKITFKVTERGNNIETFGLYEEVSPALPPEGTEAF